MNILNKLKIKKADAQPKAEAAHGKEEADVKVHGAPHKSMLLIRQPWITERAGDIMTQGKYIFIIDKDANKWEVKKAVESIYKVKVEDVNVINMKGKTRRLGRSLGRTSASKKAIVTLKQGHKIETI